VVCGTLLIHAAEVAGVVCDVRCADGRVVEIASNLAPQRDEVILEARGGALLPGLHDHHIHLNALAASLSSIRCGPPEVEDRAALARALSAEPDARGWLRGTGYFESVAGPLDRDVLDTLRADIPVRVQHRSGAMWFLNSRAIEALGVSAGSATAAPADRGEVPRVEKDSDGRPTGRLFRADAWLRHRLPSSAAPDLSQAGRQLAEYGVTTLTDATPTNESEDARRFRSAQASGALPQRLRMMGAFRVGGHVDSADSMLCDDAHKIMLDEPALPDLAKLVQAIRTAHADDRPVAIHTVTRAEILFALAALESVGSINGDRLEHASVAPPEALDLVRRLDLTVVTQPNFLSERGDAYRKHVEERDLPHLYRVRSWLDNGTRLGGGTDAPFGHPDPWRAMRAAVERRTPEGEILSPRERVSPESALALFLPRFSRATRSGPPAPPSIEIGAVADLCLLRIPWRRARLELSSEFVLATLVDGRVVFSAQP
jgi:predicted amidohydrolase YtcJ